jgi:putative polyhydroxyalkanoate system protein
MPKYSVTVPHTLTQEEAKERLGRFTESVGSSDQVSNLEQSWEGNNLRFGFKTFGIQLKGVVAVEDNQLEVDGEMPFSAMMFKGKIESEIQKMLAKLVSA